jgi:hypothetical protein
MPAIITRLNHSLNTGDVVEIGGRPFRVRVISLWDFEVEPLGFWRRLGWHLRRFFLGA